MKCRLCSEPNWSTTSFHLKPSLQLVLTADQSSGLIFSNRLYILCTEIIFLMFACAWKMCNAVNLCCCATSLKPHQANVPSFLIVVSSWWYRGQLFDQCCHAVANKVRGQLVYICMIAKSCALPIAVFEIAVCCPIWNGKCPSHIGCPAMLLKKLPCASSPLEEAHGIRANGVTWEVFRWRVGYKHLI